MKIKKNHKGFTLLEIMVAIILAGIMMAGVTIIYTQFIDMWNQDRISLQAERQGTYALGVMEKAIKSSESYTLGDYEDDKYHKITVTTLVVNKDTGVTSVRNKEYYLDKTTSPVTIKEKDIQTSVETSLCPDTFIEGGEVKSDFEVEDLFFTPFNTDGEWVSPVRIDLKLKTTKKVGDTDVDEFFDFTVSARLRNENVN